VRFKLDENVTAAAVAVLAAAGHDVDTVADEGLTGAPDEVVMAAAQNEERMLVTFDVGFGDARQHRLGSHGGVVVLRLRDQRPAMVIEVLRTLVENHDLDALAGSLLVVSDRMIRIRRPTDP
jgi:predicted nuclease of predicted toxin-antitoxin system